MLSQKEIHKMVVMNTLEKAIEVISDKRTPLSLVREIVNASNELMLEVYHDAFHRLFKENAELKEKLKNAEAEIVNYKRRSIPNPGPADTV